MAECRLRRRAEPNLAIDEWLRRFPQYRADLIQRLQITDSARVPTPSRLNCPNCFKPLTIPESGLQPSVVCPSCGGSFQVDVESAPTCLAGEHSRLGRFELLEAVGQGGFGTVYRAHDTELDRIVAVKVPRSGRLLGAEEMDRFAREARNAARLSHPGIVPVHEVGRDALVPYIVSGFVNGQTLAEAQAARRFGFREAADIIAQVAEALDYAHRQGVVHRDLKPSNIMLGQVRGVGSPKQEEPPTEAGVPQAIVMDFGLARRDEGEVSITIEGQILGTPAYMSPEQARGESHRVDGRSDLYNLGVMLYEMLTGEIPFRGTARMVLKQILEDEPRPPRQLNDRVPRDLETITLKCLAKEPNRRYASAGDLALDLRRYLRGEPIRARPVRGWERAWRWAKRKPLLASLSTLLAISLTALAIGGPVAVIQISCKRDQAVEALTLAYETYDKLVFEVQEQLEDRPALDGLKQALLNTARVGLERVRQDAELGRVDKTLIAAHERLGVIYLDLGKTVEAQQVFRQGRDLAEAWLKSDPNNRDGKRALIIALLETGRTGIRLGQREDADAGFPRALELGKALVAADPHDLQAKRDLCRCYRSVGNLYLEQDDGDSAQEAFGEAVALAQVVAAADPNNRKDQDMVAFCYERVGNANWSRQDLPAMREVLLKALPIRQDLVAANPKSIRARTQLAYSYGWLGTTYRAMERLSEANECYSKELELREALAAVDLENVQAEIDRARVVGNLGLVKLQALEYEPAIPYFEQAVATLKKIQERGRRTDKRAWEFIEHWLRVARSLGREIENLHYVDAIQADADPVVIPDLLLMRTQFLAQHGQLAEAAATAEKLRVMCPSDPALAAEYLFDAALSFSHCLGAVAVGKNANELTPEEASLRVHYQVRAAEALERTLDYTARFDAQARGNIALAPLRQTTAWEPITERLRQRRAAKRHRP